MAHSWITTFLQTAITCAIVSTPTTIHAAEANGCWVHPETKVSICCWGDEPTIMQPVILWKLAYEMCNDRFCEGEKQHSLYVGNSHYLYDTLRAKGNFSSKATRDTLLDSWFKGHEDKPMNATGWMGEATGWNGEKQFHRTYSRCSLYTNSTAETNGSAYSWIELSRTYGETM